MKTLAAITISARTMAPTRRPLVLRGALLLAFGLGEGGLFLLVFRVRTSPSRCSRAADRGVRSAGRRDTIVEATLMRERSLWLLPQALTGVAAAGLVLLLPAASALAIFAWWAVVIGLFEAGESLASGSRRVLVSVLSLALGLFVLAGPVHDPSLLLLAVALYGVLAGAGRLHAARSRRLR